MTGTLVGQLRILWDEQLQFSWRCSDEPAALRANPLHELPQNSRTKHRAILNAGCKQGRLPWLLGTYVGASAVSGLGHHSHTTYLIIYMKDPKTFTPRMGQLLISSTRFRINVILSFSFLFLTLLLPFIKLARMYTYHAISTCCILCPIYFCC
jgi:hypothetical protein